MDWRRNDLITTLTSTGAPGTPYSEDGRLILTHDARVVYQHPSWLGTSREGISTDPALVDRVRRILAGGTRRRRAVTSRSEPPTIYQVTVTQ